MSAPSLATTHPIATRYGQALAALDTLARPPATVILRRIAAAAAERVS